MTSQLKVDRISPATGDKVVIDGLTPRTNRNLIINGAMNVAQRGTQVTGNTGGAGNSYKTCDRWKIEINALGTWTIDQSTDAPNGFSNSLKMTCTTADASPAAGDFCLLLQYIEAQNLQHLAFGTADAKSMTLSFWVKSNKTGSASFDILQYDNPGKMISKSYTINSANTWEYKTISIPADIAGQIDNDNGAGFRIDWWLNSGSTFTGGSHATTWSTSDNTNRNASNLGVGGAVNDYFAITGVQLELGDDATPFEHETYGETLLKCQRYYYKTYDTPPNTWTGDHFYDGISVNQPSSTFVNGVIFPCKMRSTPSVSLYSKFGTNGYLTNNGTDISVVDGTITPNHINRIQMSSAGTYWFLIFEADAEFQ